MVEGARSGPAAHILALRLQGYVPPLSEEASMDSWARPVLGRRCSTEASTATHSLGALERMSQVEEMRGGAVLGGDSLGTGNPLPQQCLLAPRQA